MKKITITLGALAVLALGGKVAHAEETHTVQPGDTLSEISQKYIGDASLVDAIANANGIKDKHLIFVGEVLTIPGKDDAVAVENTVPEEVYTEVEQPVEQPVEYTQNTYQAETYTGGTSSAKEWIAQKESGGDYNATNGYHIGRYQLDPSYLNGDYSPENQEKVADAYVAGRYGSWENAQAFWMNNGWY